MCIRDRSLTGCTVDQDGDGVEPPEDCDDQDAAVSPGAAEVCDGRDNDCDGRVDIDALDARPWFLDADGDGVGAGEAVAACQAPDQHVEASGDCDDSDPRRHPGALDHPLDGLDSDCDGVDPEPTPPARLQRALKRLSEQGYETPITYAGQTCCTALPGGPARDGSQLDVEVDAFIWQVNLRSERRLGPFRLQGGLTCFVFPNAQSRTKSDAPRRYVDWLLDDRTFKRPAELWEDASMACVLDYPSPNREVVAKEAKAALDAAEAD